jgi:hypothetical protein
LLFLAGVPQFNGHVSSESSHGRHHIVLVLKDNHFDLPLLLLLQQLIIIASIISIG